jgi:ABC-type Zn uptake system ZnuABC Zn-binding protein ZnuA
MLLVALAALALPGCGMGNNAPAASDTKTGQIRAVTTMSVLADMIRNVGGDRVGVENIIPLGAGPEDYQPTPQDARKIAAADVVFFNGHGLEAWLDNLFESAARPGQPQIAVSAGLPAIGADDEFPEGNPHFWLSAALGARYVDAIRDGLAQVDPAGATTYAENAETYRARLLALDDELKRQAAGIPATARKIVTNHDAFPYFAQAYGFTIVGDLLGNPESEPSAGDLARLVQAIRREHVKVVVAEAQFNPKLAQTLADEAGVKVVAELYTDTLGEPGSPAPTYVEMLRYDMREIVAALSFAVNNEPSA